MKTSELINQLETKLGTVGMVKFVLLWLLERYFKQAEHPNIERAVFETDSILEVDK